MLWSMVRSLPWRASKQALDGHGVQTILSGRSYRPADNNQQYDWYLRVAQQGTGNQPSRAQIVGILGPQTPRAAQNRVFEEIEDLQHDLVQTHLSLQTAVTEKASLESALKLARAVEVDRMRESWLLKQQHDKIHREAEASKAAVQVLEQQVNTLAGELDRVARGQGTRSNDDCRSVERAEG